MPRPYRPRATSTYGQPVTPAEWLFARAEVTTDPAACWTWTGSLNGDGYGKLRVDGRMSLAHRVAYETCVGPIEDGLVLDHLCNNRACVRPSHLEPVTQGENLARGRARRRALAEVAA